MTSLYVDVNHLEETIQRVMDETDIYDSDVSLTVFTNAPVMRGITFEEVKRRNLSGNLGDDLCRLKYDGSRLTLGFHEDKVEETFELTPAGPRALNAQQATPIRVLAPDLYPVVETLNDAIDVIDYDFVEVSAASMANGGHFTDFEFEYVVTTTYGSGVPF